MKVNLVMYLIDTNVISELRKQARADAGVRQFFMDAERADHALYLSVITIGELRRGVELIRHRGDVLQAVQLERWLQTILTEYHDNILALDEDCAQLWGVLRAPHHENAIDKQIAATALIHGLTLVTRNSKDFESTRVKLVNPFTANS